MPSLSSRLSPPRVYMGSQSPALGGPGQACQAAPSTEGSWPWLQPPPALSTSPAASPCFPACHPRGFIPSLGSGDAANTSQRPGSASPIQQDKAAAALTFVQSNEKQKEAFFTRVI